MSVYDMLSLVYVFNVKNILYIYIHIYICVCVLCAFDFLCQDTGFVQEWGVPQNRNVLLSAARSKTHRKTDPRIWTLGVRLG